MQDNFNIETSKIETVWVNSKITGGHYAFKKKTAQKAFENPMGTCRSIQLYPNDIVVDIGAYIGEYTLYAQKCGVKKVISYEPTPQTFSILSHNCKNRPNIILNNQAVVGNDAKYINLYMSDGVGVTNSIVKKTGKKQVIKMPAIRYEHAICNATVVKIDVEGAEYLYHIAQPHLRAIILEFHPISKTNWKQRAYKIMEDFIRAGFRPVKTPEFKHGWDLIGSWER